MATPQDNYIVPARAGFIGQVGNIGSNNGLAGASNNASVGGTATNGVQSTNAATSAAFAVVQTKSGPTGMGAGGGSEAPKTESASFPAQAQQAVGVAKYNEEPAQFTGGLASPASLGNNVNFPSDNGKEVVLPVNDAFSKTANDVSISSTGAAKKTGITDTLANAGENDLTLTQVDNFGQAKVDPNKKLDGAAQDGQLPPLYTPANEPGGNGPNYANASKLAGNVDTSSKLPV